MSLVATYNGASFTLDPLLTWSEDVSKIMASEGRAVRGYRHIMRMGGVLFAANASGKASDITDLFDKLRESAQDLLITQDGTNVKSVLASAVQGTGPWSDYSIPGTDDPLKVGFDTPFEFRLEFITDPPTATGGVVADTFTDTFSFDKQLRRTFTRRGNLSTQSGTSAEGKFEATDPEDTGDLPTGTTWELERKEFVVDDDDQNLDYTWVYEEQHLENPTTAKDIDISISSTVREGMELWTATGRLAWEIGTPIEIGDVQTILDAVNDWPGTDGHVLAESINTDERNNALTFNVQLELPYGEGGTLEYEERVQTVTEQAVKDWHAQSQDGQDKRQVLHNPVVTVIHTWRVRKRGSIPSPIDPIIDPQNTDGSIIKKDFSNPRVTLDTKGNIASGELSGVYTIRPLNNTKPNQFRLPVPPSASNPIQGQTPSREV